MVTTSEGIDPGVGVVPYVLQCRKVIRLCKLPAKFGSIPFAQCEVSKEIQLIGVTEPGFIDHVGVDVPHVGDLGIVVIHISRLATDWTFRQTARVDDRRITLRVGHG